ncbi:hypothetical protein LTR10_003302 [Elasticomyces elasticus]|nr:hypothetical protein LTR10_003302 [Elasticomyces elasticus]KAK4969572.1 hypothetical protein LTR42_008843 [Elasticomyces elasticus]
MPFTSEPVSSMSGRNSRASNVSGMTGASHSVRSGHPPVPKANDMFANAGVLSMLKTSTDTGDIGALSFNHGRLPAVPRASHQRRGHTARPSVSDMPRPGGSSHHYPTGQNSHHHYAPSQNSRLSDSTFARRGSLTSMQSMPPALPTVGHGNHSLQMPTPTFDRARDSRSYSMTSAPAAGQLPRHRSATSLKSAGHEPRHGSRLHPTDVPPMPENRQPYVYPTRLKRPGYRSPSPALSEMSGRGHPMQPGMQMPPANMRSVPMQRPQYQTYNSDYGNGYPPEPHHLNVRPPPRAMNVSPIMGYEQPQFAYRPEAMRSDPGLPMPPMPPMPQSRQYRQPHHGMPPPVRSGYPGQQYGPPRPGYAQYPPMQHPAYVHPAYRGPPPQPHMAPMAHSMFHNAARMARHLPQRTDTPLTDMGPPSSDPPSSGTAPTSSNPPTPKDQTTINMAVDPLFIDAAINDLPDSSSEPVLSAKYFAYAEGLDKGIDEQEIEVPHPSVPPTGFVQRVRAMLESRAAVEAAAQRDAERDPAVAAAQHGNQYALQQIVYTDHDIPELHEMAANETPRFTIIEEFEAPVELPASPVKRPEQSNSPAKSNTEHRLTRELVKAELAESSNAQDSSTEGGITETTDFGPDEELSRNSSKQTSSSKHTGSSKPSTDENDNGDTPSTGRKPSTPGSAITTSPERISGMDYALRFSVPVDTTTATDETNSRDPFMLDADTITFQHQRAKENGGSQNQQTELPHSSLVPVSPLQPDEDVSRCSAVSPLHTQTAGIDETLRLRPSTEYGSSEYEQSQSVVGQSTQDSVPPPTPRTPRTYSKSVQLPRESIATMNTPTSNRFSLPPDLSTVVDTTMNTNSDMITNVAVRFSLPNTTITIGRPQIVTIPPSSSPDKPESPPPKSKFRTLEPRSALRSSVTFADQIAPLNITKSDSRHEPYPTETGNSRGKSIMRRPSPIDESTDSSRGSRDSTTELRFATGNGFNGRFGSTHLPGLKEESIEDMSISDQQKRSSSRTESQQLMLPARIAAVKAMQERRLHESAEKAKARRAARHHNRSLAETRDLPSLNFSRMDLIDKLNQALEVRPTKSMEVVRRRDFSAIYCPSPQRPQSTEPLRDRYTSFFSKPEDFSFFDDDPDADDAEENVNDGIPTVEIQESTRIEDQDERNSRALSPEDFLNVATQVNRLSIPSMSGFSEKLTNLIPALRNLHLDSILASDDEVAHTIEDIQHLGNGGRRETVLSTRTSAGFRTLAERADEIVRNGTHDSVLPSSRLLLTNKELPPLPISASTGRVSAMSPTDEKQSYLSGSVSAPTDLCMPARPSSALVRQKSPATEDEVRQLLPPEMNPITRGKRSLVISSASRPWNQDENYPWASTSMTMDLNVPSAAHVRDSVTGELQRTGPLNDLSTSMEPTETTKGIDIGSILTDADCTSITTEQATGLSHQQHARKQSKRSIIGSISKKIGFNTQSRLAADDTIRSVTSPALRSEDSIPHKTGDRYPTTSLTPPANMHLDEVRSFFSDNSSERKHRAENNHTSLRKRLTGFNKPKYNRAVRLDASRRHSLDDTMTYDAGSLNADRAERIGATSAAETIDGIGMGKAEFRIKRFGEKLRHLFAKGGDLIRNLSTRSRAPRSEREREDWLSDSMYSGV